MVITLYGIGMSRSLGVRILMHCNGARDHRRGGENQITKPRPGLVSHRVALRGLQSAASDLIVILTVTRSNSHSHRIRTWVLMLSFCKIFLATDKTPCLISSHTGFRDTLSSC